MSVLYQIMKRISMGREAATLSIAEGHGRKIASRGLPTECWRPNQGAAVGRPGPTERRDLAQRESTAGQGSPLNTNSYLHFCHGRFSTSGSHTRGLTSACVGVTETVGWTVGVGVAPSPLSATLSL